jgi:peptide/nickel transport system substrate-binding protein
MSHMNRLRSLLCCVLVLLSSGVAVATPQASSAAGAVFYGHWPYTFKTPINLNAFALDGYPASLGFYADLIELPSAYYLWATGEYEGLLAESWGFEGETSYVVRLRQDAQWSDGSPLTSRDLVTTYAVARLRNVPEYRYIGSVSARDEHTVVFTLKRPSLLVERLILKTRIRPASIYGVLGDPVTALLAQGDNLALWDAGKLQTTDTWKALVKQLNDLRPKQIVASGPYTLVAEDITTDQVTLRKHDRSAFTATANFETIVVFKGNNEKILPRLQKGEITYSQDSFPPESEAELTAQGYTLLRTPSYAGPAIFFNHQRAALGRVEVRRALAHVLDRSKIAEAGFGASAATHSSMSGLSDLLIPRWFDEARFGKLNPYPPNLDEATALLTKAGYTKPRNTWVDAAGEALALKLNFPGEFQGYPEVAQSIADQLGAFGISVFVEPLSSTDLLKAVGAGRFDLALWTWGVIGNPFPYNTYRLQLVSLNAPGLTKGDPGIGFALQHTLNGQAVDLEALITTLETGIDEQAQVQAATTIAAVYNAQLPILPLAERYTSSPLLAGQLSNVPPSTDPIFLNAYSADNYVMLLLLRGTLSAS